MRFYIASKHKILALDENHTADMVIDDFIQIVQDNFTKIADNNDVLGMMLRNNPGLKYVYEVNIDRK